MCHKVENAAAVTTAYTRIWQIVGLNLGPDSGYSDWLFVDFISSSILGQYINEATA
jgi:hypothetical protein